MVQNKEIFSIRKIKKIVAGVTLGVALVGTNALVSVSADETKAATATPESIIHTVDNGDGTVTTTEPLKITDDVAEKPTEIKSDIPKKITNATQDEAVKAVDKAQDTLKDDVKTAKDAGVVVKQDNTKKEVVINDGNASSKTSEVLSDLHKQDLAVKKATEVQKANQQAYDDTKADRDKTVADNQKALAASAEEVDKLVAQAKKAGLLVEVTDSKTSPSYKDVKGLTGNALRKVMAENLALYKEAVQAGITIQDKSVEELQKAIDLYKSNQKAYNDTTKDLEVATDAGLKALDSANKKQDGVLQAAEKSGVKATSKTTESKVDYVDLKGLTGNKLREAMKKNLALYKEAYEKAVKDTNTSTDEMQAKLDAYNKAMAEYNKKLADWNAGKLNSQSGVKWKAGTNVQAGAGSTRVNQNEQWPNGSAGEWASAAIQNLNKTENTDANFNNMFKLNNGVGSVVIKNTSNGDVTISVSNIDTYTAGAHDYYLVVWGANDGGIAWGVFTMAYTNGNTGNAGEGGNGGGGAISGRIIDAIRSFDWKVTTTGEVSSFTYNDIDNRQFITVNGINGTIKKGKFITQAGNKFSSGGGDVSQGSSGVVDTNGIQYVFDKAQKISVSGVHGIDGTYYPSIVAGIFGVTSEVKPPKPVHPNPIELEGVRYTVELPGAPETPKTPKVAVQKVTVETPDAPEAPKPQEVSVHYFEMKKTPAPVQKASLLPHTGSKESVLGLVGVSMLAMLGLGTMSKRKEEN